MPERSTHIIFEKGIRVEAYFPNTGVVMIDGDGFCVVKRPFTPKIKKNSWNVSYTSRDPNIFYICSPQDVRDREVVFVSPTIKFRYELLEEIRRQDNP